MTSCTECTCTAVECCGPSRVSTAPVGCRTLCCISRRQIFSQSSNRSAEALLPRQRGSPVSSSHARGTLEQFR